MLNEHSASNMEVMRLFKWWQTVIYPVKNGFLVRVHDIVLGSKPFTFFLPILLASFFLGAVVGQGSAMKTMMALRLPISIVPCLAGVHFFAFKRRVLNELLQSGATLAADLSAGGADPPSKTPGGRLLTMSQKGYQVMQMWSGAAALSLMVPVIMQGRLAMEMWPWFDGQLGLWLGGVLQAASAYPLAFPIYIACILMWSLTEALAALFVITGNNLEEAASLLQVCKIARIHASLCHVTRKTAALLDVVLTNMTVGLLLTPAISTVMVVRGAVDVFCATSIPFLLPFYVMCRAGQSLEDASTRVRDSALGCFNGLLRDRRTQDAVHINRMLLMVMIRSSKPTSMEVFRGTVRYNLHTCHDAFKSWYSMLQYLLNVPD